MDPVPQAVRAQVHVAAQHYRKHFGRDPDGIWLPECAYLPGHEVFLKEAGIRFSFLESHGLTDAHPRPSYGVHAPIVSPGGVVFFGRDMESSRQVWSAESGYPGDFDYREFYKDVGWELPMEYLADFLPDGQRKNLGIKYYRVTGRGPTSATSSPTCARGRWRRRRATPATSSSTASSRWSTSRARCGAPPIVVSPYDAELFGHWWFEGPEFLDYLFRKMHFDQDVVKPTTPSEYLERFPDLEVCQPPMCTWGAKGYAEVWLNGSTTGSTRTSTWPPSAWWSWRDRYEHPSGLERRALDQAARELLLAQSSDWAFIMKTGTTVEYAKKRTRDHVARFDYLYRALTGQCALEEPILARLRGARQHLPRDRLPGLPVGRPRQRGAIDQCGSLEAARVQVARTSWSSPSRNQKYELAGRLVVPEQIGFAVAVEVRHLGDAPQGAPG